MSDLSDWMAWLWFLIGLLLGVVFGIVFMQAYDGWTTCQAINETMNQTCQVGIRP